LSENLKTSNLFKCEIPYLKELFENVLPDYDRDRFYVSHMKKVVDWYSCLKNYATLDFVQDEEQEEAAAE
jgi:hypothetical protein